MSDGREKGQSLVPAVAGSRPGQRRLSRGGPDRLEAPAIHQELHRKDNQSQDQSGKGGEKVSASDIDDFFSIVEAALVKAGSDTSVLRGKSFAEIQELFAQMRGDKDAPPAPDADTFNAIKNASKKGRKP